MKRSSLRSKLLASHILLVAVALALVELFNSGDVDLLPAALVSLTLALVVGLVVARVSVKPLDAMTKAANDIAQGDFDAVVVHSSSDELGVLSTALASLASQLASRIGDLTGERDRLSAMLAGMVEGVLVVTRDGRVLIANRSAETILEPSGPLVGRTLLETIRHPVARQAITVALREGRASENLLENIGSQARSVTLSVQPLAPSGEGGAVAVLHDLTPVKRLETIRRDFVSNVSHELQTPVASIQSYAEALLDGALDEPANARKFAEVIHRNAMRMGRLVKDLLKLSQLEARGSDKVVRESIDVQEIAGYVVQTVREREASGEATIDVDIPSDLRAIGDPDGLEEVLLNLVDNALKYGRRGGTIRVRGAREGEWARITVGDDGPGIESRHLPRLFERFYRIDEGRSRERGGTGLGLAIVKHLTESMGGTTHVESEVGRGSTFIVRLPADDSPAEDR